MFHFEQWQITNERYLASALDWLRARLAVVADGSGEPTPFPQHVPARGEDPRHPPALEVLAARAALSDFEKSVLLLCAALEFDPRIAARCASLQGDPARLFPTAALAFSRFADPAWDAFSPERPLRRLRLVEVERRGGLPLTSSPLRCDERVVNYLKGLNHLEPRLAGMLTLEEEQERELPPSQQQVVDELVAGLERTAKGGTSSPSLVQLVGMQFEDHRLLALAVARAGNLRLCRVDAAALPTAPDEVEAFLALWERERLLLPLGLLIDAQDVDRASAGPLSRLLRKITGLVICSTAERLPGLNSSNSISVDVARPTAAEQLAAWRRELLGLTPEAAQQVAGNFDLNLPAIERIAAAVPTEQYDDPRQLAVAIWQRCREHTRPRLDELAQRVDCRATWDDFVLADEDLTQLRQITAQVRHRGKVLDEWGFRRKMNRGFGVTALFAGESGTGKTMAAEVIATDLQLDLYRIDLASVINKYIGETEKNLRRLFDAAEGSGAILFFDEADALFGKRSEVKDSHDRFANIETNYLLQRMESYRGLAILATNNKSALDHAFTRRLRFIIDFRFPDQHQRKAIWQRAYPAETPLGEIDFGELAKLRLTGGNVHNIALNAAFIAAASNLTVDMRTVLLGANGELAKSQQCSVSYDFVRDGGMLQ